MVASPVLYPVVRHLPVVLANIQHGLVEDGPVFLAATASFRRFPTSWTRAFEVVAFKEEALTLVRCSGRHYEILEIRDRYFLAFRDGTQCPNLSDERSIIPSKYRIWAATYDTYLLLSWCLRKPQDDTPVINARKGLKNSRIKDVMTGHPRNVERVGRYYAHYVVRIR